jgi:thymidylate synthase ThyX
MSEPTVPYAEVIADSINDRDDRLTTMKVVAHRFVLAEFNTHRVFSRNSASSRAIPLEKQLERVKTDPAWPLTWPAEQPGMQGGGELEGTYKTWAEGLFLKARDAVVAEVESYMNNVLKESRLHKSYINRLLEPFMWHTIIVSSTEWENFFAQRCSPLAQPEIRWAAEAMERALISSTPVKRSNSWHLPLVDEDLRKRVGDNTAAKISAARCARVSYLTHDGVVDPVKDIDLYTRLATAKPPHWSPLEHAARPSRSGERSANFKGWTQLRQIEEDAS